MKRLLLLRHAKSSWKSQGLLDFDRPLNKRGRGAAPAMGRYLAAEGLAPDGVLCSAARRAEETWELVSDALFAAGCPAPRCVKHYRSLYLASPARMLETIRRQPAGLSTLLLIAHNPGTANLAARLAGKGSEREALARLAEGYPTAALAELSFAGDDWRGLEFAGAKLMRLVTPRALEALAPG